MGFAFEQPLHLIAFKKDSYVFDNPAAGVAKSSLTVGELGKA